MLEFTLLIVIDTIAYHLHLLLGERVADFIVETYRFLGQKSLPFITFF